MRLVTAIGAMVFLGACQMSAPPSHQSPAPPMISPPSHSGNVPPTSRPPISRPPSAIPPDSGSDSCGASRLQHLVGRPLPQPFPARGPVRIFATGDPVTMDYRGERLNVEVDRRNPPRIVAITCG